MAIADGDELDRALQDLARPATPVTPAVEDQLAVLTIATLRASIPRRRRRAWQAALIGGISLAAVLGVGATAVATGLWAPWALEPEGSFRYTLPSGVTCEQRVGDLVAENPDVRRAVQEIFASTDVVGTSDIAGWADRLGADDSARQYAEAIVAQSDTPGTPTIEDVVYGMAVSQAVIETVSDELAARGFDVDDENNLISVQGQTLCGEELR